MYRDTEHVCDLARSAPCEHRRREDRNGDCLFRVIWNKIKRACVGGASKESAEALRNVLDMCLRLKDDFRGEHLGCDWLRRVWVPSRFVTQLQ